MGSEDANCCKTVGPRNTLEQQPLKALLKDMEARKWFGIILVPDWTKMKESGITWVQE
jgi:hypothetical protein